MTQFSLNEKLKQDSYILSQSDSSILLLNRNALFPWFVIVPITLEVEFYRLDVQQQLELVKKINLLSTFIENTFVVDKMNIATIGNVVSQLHIHVIGRKRNDACWPNVVWGTRHFESYTEEKLDRIRTAVETKLLHS